eukprot:sb/3478520/
MYTENYISNGLPVPATEAQTVALRKRNVGQSRFLINVLFAYKSRLDAPFGRSKKFCCVFATCCNSAFLYLGSQLGLHYFALAVSIVFLVNIRKFHPSMIL